MTEMGTTDIEKGRVALNRLMDDVPPDTTDRNEAETRFQIIDRIIVECLGWPRESVHVEQSDTDRAYTDYELGSPRCAIWEAKRQNHTFELPANPQKQLVQNLRSVMALSAETSAAIEQVQSYCSSRGVDVAVATNGYQLVAFLATRTDGMAPLDGHCLVVGSAEQLADEFPRVWQTLSPAGLYERRLNRLLNMGEDQALPQKISSLLSSYPRYRYPSELQTTLRNLGELLLIDLIEAKEVEKQFYRECYCESGALSQHALVSKQMLKARYSAMFDQEEKAPAVTALNLESGENGMNPELAIEAISGRPIILIGDVGVGKTSFLKHLVYVTAEEEFKNAIYMYIDLGSQGALEEKLEVFVLSEVEEQLHRLYDIDVYGNSFVRGVYHGELMRFRHGIYGSLRDEDPTEYQKKERELLENLTGRKAQHLRKSVNHLVRGQRKQVVIILDNADQRDYGVQQDAFIIGHNFAKDWQATVFLAVRPQTFYRSKQVGSLTAYPHRVFTISPPRVDRVIEKRLLFAVNLAEGKAHAEWLSDVKLQLPNVANFLKALIQSLSRNTELVEFLSNITAGNIRAVVEFVANFMGSANVNAQKVIDIMGRSGRYTIPIHEFWKAAMLGEYSYYDSRSSMAQNVFEVWRASPNEHFLLPMVLAYLDFNGDYKTAEGFVPSRSIVDEMQNWSFTPAVTEEVLRRANNKKLVETPQRVTFEEDEGGYVGVVPEYFRISTIGAYHLRRWITDFSYLDAMAFDTPILEENIRTSLSLKKESFAISDRLDRAQRFKGYLTDCWRNSGLSPRYFDWLALLEVGADSFTSVERAVDRIGGAIGK